jgi:hypothetical protein
MESFRKIFNFILPGTPLNRSLRILIATNASLVFLLGLFGPFYAVFVVSIGGSIALAGVSWALMMIVSGLLIFLFSNWELKVKEQELLIALGYVLRAGVFLSYAFMTNIPQLLATQVLWGVASAIGTPAFDAVYADHTAKESSIVQWGQWEGISAIMTGIAAIIGGFVIESFGYQVVFISMCLISLFLGLYIWRLPREVL